MASPATWLSAISPISKQDELLAADGVEQD
jgi:hypothetical protein